MIYACRFCDWKSIYPNKMKEHVIELHPMITKTIKVRENSDKLAIKAEDLIHQEIWVCNDRGFLNTEKPNTINKCRYCSSKFKNSDSFKKHIETYHTEKEIELEIREITDGYIVTEEELDRKNVEIK